MADNLTPGVWDIYRTRGDSNTPTAFTLTKDGSPWLVDSAVAQVRVRKSATSTLLHELPVDVTGAVVTVGGFEELDFDPTVAYWDLEVTDSDYVSGFTIVGGSFVLEGDVSEVTS